MTIVKFKFTAISESKKKKKRPKGGQGKQDQTPSIWVNKMAPVSNIRSKGWITDQRLLAS